MMHRGVREENIKKIIAMENRISVCRRCNELQRCSKMPALGKGDLVPEAVLVFESTNKFTENIDNVIKIRQMISLDFDIEKIYHTFLVRCQPKACPLIMNTHCYGECQLIDKDNKCVLNNELCSGIPVRATDAQIISCLTYALEEIEILEPRYVFLFGDRVCKFLLRAWGDFDDYEIPHMQKINEYSVFLLDYEDDFNQECCGELKMLLSS